MSRQRIFAGQLANYSLSISNSDLCHLRVTQRSFLTFWNQRLQGTLEQLPLALPDLLAISLTRLLQCPPPILYEQIGIGTTTMTLIMYQFCLLKLLTLWQRQRKKFQTTSQLQLVALVRGSCHLPKLEAHFLNCQGIFQRNQSLSCISRESVKAEVFSSVNWRRRWSIETRKKFLQKWQRGMQRNRDIRRRWWICRFVIMTSQVAPFQKKSFCHPEV